METIKVMDYNAETGETTYREEEIDEKEIIPDNSILIENLKKELATYDYIGIKIAMGVATRDDYADKIAYTEELRKQIRQLEEVGDVND